MGFEILLSPMSIGSMTVKNRTVMTAAEMSLGQTDGRPTEKLMDYYEERAKGGVGLIIPGICRVNDMGAASTFTQLSMSHDYHIAPMAEFAGRIHRHGAKLCIQLHHPGRQGYASSINTLPVVIPLVNRFPGVLNALFKCTPALLALEARGICQSVQAPSKCELSAHGATRIHAMSRREIKNLIRDFVNAADRCQKAGVDAVELHGGHGYLIQQFLSPNTNLRTDEYGGSFENRMRFITEIICGIRRVCGRDYPIIVRLTADEMYERIGKPGKGYTLEEGKRIAKRLEELGVDAINVTSACYDVYNRWLEPTSFEPGWRAYLAKEIKSVVTIPVIAANFIRSPQQAERQLEEGYQDFIGSARTFICDPDWVNKTAAGRPEEIRRCIGCLNCIKSFMENATVGKNGECALNPAVGRELEDAALPRDGAGRPAVVVGAGPAGLMAAQTLARRGFAVTVLEKGCAPGGQVNTAAACLLKDKLHWCVEDLMTSVTKLGVELRFGTEATVENVKALNPAAVIVASGGSPIVPKSIKGVELGHVCTAPDIINGLRKPNPGRAVVVGSGLTGLETAEILCEYGCRVTVLEMAGGIAPGAWFQLVDDELERLEPKGVRFITNQKLTEIRPGEITVEDMRDGHSWRLIADTVVLSMGVRPENRLYNELCSLLPNVCAVGDARSSGRIADAVKDGYYAAANLLR